MMRLEGAERLILQVIRAVQVGPHDFVTDARIAQETGVRVVVAASAVCAVKGTDGYLETIDYNVKSIAQAMK